MVLRLDQPVHLREPGNHSGFCQSIIYRHHLVRGNSLTRTVTSPAPPPSWEPVHLILENEKYLSENDLLSSPCEVHRPLYGQVSELRQRIEGKRALAVITPCFHFRPHNNNANITTTTTTINSSYRHYGGQEKAQQVSSINCVTLHWRCKGVGGKEKISFSNYREKELYWPHQSAPEVDPPLFQTKAFRIQSDHICVCHPQYVAPLSPKTMPILTES